MTGEDERDQGKKSQDVVSGEAGKMLVPSSPGPAGLPGKVTDGLAAQPSWIRRPIAQEPNASFGLDRIPCPLELANSNALPLARVIPKPHKLYLHATIT